MNPLQKHPFHTQSNWNAILSTAFMMFLMHPCVILGVKLPDLGVLAWVHLVPIILIQHRSRFKRKFSLNFVAAFLGTSGALYWLIFAMKEFGNISLFPALGILALLSAFLAFTFALPLSIATWVNRINHVPFFILLPTFLLFRDVFLSHFPWGGFPWLMPAYSQGQWLKFFQWVDHTGPMGLNFFIYLMNGLIADGLILFFYGKQLDKLVSRLLVAFVLLLISLFGNFLAGREFAKTLVNKGSLTVALVQGNISQSEKWDPYLAQSHLHVYLQQTNRAIKNGAALVIWPETAYPYGLIDGKLLNETFLDQSSLPVPLFFGAVVFPPRKEDKYAYNGVFQVDQTAHIANAYYKMHLVPFGEYLPMESVFSHFGSVVNEVGSFRSGIGPKLFEVKGFQFASLICFEDVFPELAIQNAKMGADVLVNYTNDAWYGDSSAQYQHLVLSQFRALETRRPLLRATNTGYTAVIGPEGDVLNELAPFQRKTLMHGLEVEVGESYYVNHGDNWVYFVLGFATLVFLYTELKWLFGPVKKVG